jgi:hypothetical protein
VSCVMRDIQVSEYHPMGTGAVRYQLERNWLGEGNSTATLTSSGPFGVWRIKIDEDDGIAIVSSTLGGISSLDLRAHHRPLWSIPEVYPFMLRLFHHLTIDVALDHGV